MRRAARVDGNHHEIVQALRKLGASVIDLRTVGDGCPDLVVGWLGRSVLLEIKAGKGKHTTDQESLLAGWAGEAYTVRSIDEAIKAIIRK